MHKKVLVVATSSKTRGGITSVINNYKKSSLWKSWNCIWIETHIDRSVFLKSCYFIKSCLLFLLNIYNTTIVHFHLSGHLSVKRKLIFIKFSKIFKKKIIIHFHAFSSESKIDLKHKSLYSKVFNLADVIIVLSESWKLGLINDLQLNEGKIKVVYNPCPIIKLHEEIQKENIILYAGTLNERKNYKTLINAFSIIAKEFPNWKLVFAGNGEVTQGIDLVRRLEVENQVDFKGWIAGEDKYQLFSKATIFCLPSFAEGFPMSVLDAWAYGLPVITTPVGGIPDVAIDGENIILFNPNDVIALSEKLRKLIVDKDLQYKLSKEAINFSNKQFSINFISKKINNIYSKLNENRNT